MGSQCDAVEEAKLQSLGREGSMYSLTLDEVQNQLGDLGKPLGSMNLDELLKSVCSAQKNSVGFGVWASVLPGKGSITLSRDLGKKTVDEVWRDIQQKKGNGADCIKERKAQQRQPNLGEMTLEDFLVEAGVNTELPPPGNDGSVPYQTETSQFMQLQLPSAQNQSHQHGMMALFMPGNLIQQSIPVLDATYHDSQTNFSPSSLMETIPDAPMPGRKRAATGDVPEKTVERKQKRMIKNRESAARSRARRQAYTRELEIKVSRLEEENQRLGKQKELEKALPWPPPPKPQHLLRRMSSAPF